MKIKDKKKQGLKKYFLKRVLFIFSRNKQKKANKNNKMKKQIIYSNDKKLRKAFEIHFWQQDVFCF